MTNNQLVSSPYSKVFTAFLLKINEFKLWNMGLIKKKKKRKNSQFKSIILGLKDYDGYFSQAINQIGYSHAQRGSKSRVG